MNPPHLTLITGASGFIGSHIARLLFNQGRPLRLLLRKNSPTENLKGLRYETVYGDIRDTPSVAQAIKGVEIVYHVAALFALWARNRRDFFDINVRGTETVCREALKAGVKRLVYTSTTGAVGVSQSSAQLCHEKTAWNMACFNDPYMTSKYEAEEIVKKYISKGLNGVILNPTAPIGPGDVHLTPMGKMICDFAAGKIPVCVDARFALVDVQDVAMGHWLAEQKGKIGERYILSAENLTAADVLERLGKVCNRKPPRFKLPHSVVKIFAGFAEWSADYITHRPPPITRSYAALLPSYFWFDNTKSKKELGLEYHSIDQAMKKAVEWFCAAGLIK